MIAMLINITIMDAREQFIEEQISAMRLEAVKRNGLSLKYIANKTAEVCRAAIKQNITALQYVAIREIQLEAVKSYGLALMWIKDQTDEIPSHGFNAIDIYLILYKL